MVANLLRRHFVSCGIKNGIPVDPEVFCICNSPFCPGMFFGDTKNFS